MKTGPVELYLLALGYFSRHTAMLRDLLLAGGLLLLLIGTILTIWSDALRERLERLQADWHEMG